MNTLVLGRPDDKFRKILLLKIVSRHIDAYLQINVVDLPDPCHGHGLLKNRTGQGAHETLFLGDRDKSAGRQFTPLGVPPSRQAFNPYDLTRFNLDLRLEDRIDITFGDAISDFVGRQGGQSSRLFTLGLLGR